jgi:hypothetical protein
MAAAIQDILHRNGADQPAALPQLIGRRHLGARRFRETAAKGREESK